MSEGGSRRAVAEIRFGEDRSGLTKVGGRSIHQYWSLLSPHFRDVLLAPQRRSDDGGVAWTWREALDKKPLTAAELAGVRKRLERGNESFAENPVNPLLGDDQSGTRSQALIDQVAAKVKVLAESLSAKSDTALADFVCRTETGIMVHSWGVAAAAQIYYPDALESGVSGVVLVSGKPSAGHEVVIENASGLSVARMQSDEAGAFQFPKIAPGRYRIRVTSGRVKFAAKGVNVTVERGVVTRLEMASTSNPDEPEEIASDEAKEPSTDTLPSELASSKERGGPGKTLVVLLLVLLLGGGGVWVWRSWSASNKTDTRVATQGSSMMPEAFSHGENKPSAVTLSANAAGGDGELSPTVDGVGVAKTQPKQSMPAMDFGESRTTNVASTRATSTIGSRIEVQSGVTGSSGAGSSSSKGATGTSSKLTGEVSASGSVETAGNMVQGNSSSVRPISKIGRNTRVTVADPSAAGALPEAGAPGADAGAGEINNAMPSETPAGAINADVGAKTSGGAAIGSGSSSVAEHEAAPEAGSVSGSSTEETSSDSVTAEKAKSGEAQRQGPKVMTSVVEKKQSGKSEKPDVRSNASQPNKSTDDVEKKPAKTSLTTAARRSPGTGKSGSAAAQSGGSVSTPSEEVSGQKTTPQGEGLASKANADSQAEPENGENAKSDQKETQSAKESGPDDETRDSATAPAVDFSKTVIEFRVPDLELKLIRDAIVPTLPVLVGESDAAELSRNILLKEKRDLMPETFRAPVIHYGIVLELDTALGGQGLEWEAALADREMQRSVRANRAELVWRAGVIREGERVLIRSDGKQAARVIFAQDGSFRIELLGKTKAVLWIGVALSSKDGVFDKDQRPARFGWQVLRGVAPHLSWINDDSWSGGRRCRLEVLLNNKPASRTVVAIVDHLTGWSFSGEF